MYHYSELANAVRIKNRQQDGSDPFADYSDEELAKAYQTKYPELSKQINWGMDYSGQLNRAASTPQMVLPGGRIAQAPAVGVFADPVSPESMGARVTLQPPQASPVRPQMAAEATAVRRLTPAARSAAVSPVWAEEQARRAQMAQPTLTPGERAAQEERNLVAADEVEYQNYVQRYQNEWEADKKNRSGRAILDYRLSSGKRPLMRNEFARVRAGYAVPEAWIPQELAANATRERTKAQALGEASGFIFGTLAKPATDLLPGNENGFSDLSLASRTRRNFETQANAADLREAAKSRNLTAEESQWLEENDPGLVNGTVAAVKGIPGMVKGAFTNPEERRQLFEGMAQEVLPSLAVGNIAGAVAGVAALKVGKYLGPAALKARNVRKAFMGRVAPAVVENGVVIKKAFTEADALASHVRWLQMADGRKAVAELYEKVRMHPNLARELARETLGDGLADAFVETLNGYGRGETAGFVENFVSGLPLDVAPYLAINAGKRAVKRIKDGPENGLTRQDFNAVVGDFSGDFTRPEAGGGNMELAPTIENKMGVPVMPGHVLDENGNVVMNTKKGKEQYALTQKAGSTATRPQVEAAMQRPDLKDRMRDLAAMARNPETAGMKYRLGNEDISLELTPEELQAASYGNREGSQTVNGYNQQRKGYEYAQNEYGTIRSIETQRPVAHITRNGGASTIAHETIHGIEDKVRKIGTDAAEGTGDAKFLDMVDDWTERAYEWGRKNDVILPGPKELLTQAMTYRLGWDDDFDKSVKALPMPDELVQAFAARAGDPMRGGSGLRKDGVKMDDMPLPEKPAQQETQAEPQAHDLAGIEIPELDEGEELPFSFAGKNARNADQGARAEAERRLDAGEYKDAVRKATGWFRGADGRMRFEVDDSKAKLKNISWFQGEGEGSGYLPDVLEHDELFAAYPDLKYVKTKVFIAPNTEVDGAYFQPSENAIKVSARNKDDAAAYLIHEVQHAIQSREGFAKGSNNEYAAIDKSRAEFELERTGERIAQLRAQSPNDQAISELESRYNFLRGELDGPERNFYLRSAGETEARNTQARRDLTVDQRRESAPWDTQDVKDGEQIVRFSMASDAGIPQHRADDPATIELARKQWAEKGVESPFFKKWFRGSKVVDGQGAPLAMYHGTSGAGFDTFGTYEGNHGLMGVGSYFTSNPDVGSSYAAKGRGNSPGVYKAYLNVKNPLDMDAKANPDQWREAFAGAENYHEGGDTNESWLRAVENMARDEGRYASEVPGEIREGLEAMGYDGVTHMGGGRFGAKDGQAHRVVIAFHPEQIKSATGNRGTFESENPDIRFSLASDAGVPEGRADDPKVVEAARKAWSEKGVESPWFKRWFGDSKVVDGQGKPLVVYHGSKSDFNIFDLQRAGRNGQALGIGFYFTNSESIASGYGNTNSFYLKMNNPVLSVKKKTITRVQVKKIVDILEKEDEYLLSNYGDVSTSGRASVMNDALNDVHGGSANDVDVITSLINMSGIPRESVMNAVIDVTGKDGLVVPADIAYSDAEHGDNVYVALLPTQIKSATGNRGTFDAGDADIRFSLKSNDPAQVDLFSGDVYDKLVTREGTNDKQKDAGRGALRDLRRRIGLYNSFRRNADSSRGYGEILGVSLYKGFVEGKANSLVGQAIKGPADLATIAQVYRDPRFETFRVVYVNSEKVVGEAGYSSRMAAAVNVPIDIDSQINADLERFSADGYYLMHNHPSGQAKTSPEDYKLTEIVRSKASGFLGHVVIDFNEWSLIDKNGVKRDSMPIDAGAVDFNSDPELPNPILGRPVQRGRDIVSIAKELQRDKGLSTLVMTNSRGRVSLITTFPDKLLEELYRGTNGLKLKAAIRNMAGSTGAGGPRFLVMGDNASHEAILGAKRSGVFTDVVATVNGVPENLRASGWEPNAVFNETDKAKAIKVYEDFSDLAFSLSKSDPRQKILSHVTRAMRENGLKPMAQNDMSSEWRTFSKKAKADPVQRAKEVKAWDAVEESLRRFVADNPAIAAEAGLRPPTEGDLDDFDVADAVDRFRVWTNSSTQGKFTAEELDHFAQASDAAQNGPESIGMGDHAMTKRTLLGMARTHKMGNMIRFESLGEKFNAKWVPEKKAWVVTRAGGKESFEIPRDGSVWVDGEQARAPEFNDDAYPLRDDRNLRAANAEQTAMGEGDLEKSESEESRLDALARHVQDSMRDLRKLQERVKNKEADPYREYDLAAGRGDHSGAKMREKFQRPILQLMEKHGLEQKTVDSYLYARHAAERNKSVAEKNPDFQDGGSGMKTKDAEEILQNFAMDAVRNQALESIGKISDKLNEWRLDMQVKSGLLSEVDAKAMQAAWKHYVPLRGIPGDEDARPGVFRGKVAKQDKKKAMGRKSKAESVLAQNFAVTLDAIVNAQRNIAARELWKMAGANPDSKYWELDPSYVRNVQGKDGQVTQMADLQRMQKAPGIVPVFIKGEPHYIEFKTPEGGRIAAAIKELNAEQSNTLIRGLGKVNRFVGSMITQYSPEFVLTNFSRDYLTALTVAYARDGVKIARRMVTQVPAAVVGLARSEMGLRNDWTDWKERCESAGGKVGFMQSKDFKSLADDIEDDLKDLSRSNYNPKKWANVVGKVVESANGSVESATRLAYFRALVENGVDEKVAAQKYKELTVNFNRRGDWKWANQFWMFFNASVQGSANIAKLFTDKDPDVRKRAYAAAGAIASAGAAVALYNQFLGGEDEDSGKTHYERMPGWAKNNAAVLLNPKSKDGSALTIPLPYGLNVIWNTGRMMAEGASRQDGFTAMDAASEIAGSIVGSFSPFGADIDPGNIPGTLLGLATPTAAKPWMELALNKNFAGRPVMPENIPGMVEKPESELYFQGVNPYARELAAFLNTETGGDKWHAGGVSVSPEKMEHVFNAYTGGVGRMLQQGLGIAKTWGEGNETTIRQWPFARRFFSSAPEGVDRSAFMAEVLNPAKQDMAQLKDMAKSEDADVDQFVDEHYANIVASAAFGGLKTKEKRLKRAEELSEKIGTSGVKEEYRSFFAKAWKAKREMDTLQEEHNATTDQAKRAELRKRIEKEAEKAFEGFGK